MSELLWGRSETKEAWAAMATSESPKYHQRVRMKSPHVYLVAKKSESVLPESSSEAAQMHPLKLHSLNM